MPEAQSYSDSINFGLLQLKEKLRDLELETPEIKEDRRLINWLRARDLSVNEAEAMFRKHINWRKENKIDTILLSRNVPEDAITIIPAELIGNDLVGNPVLALYAGGFEIKKTIQKFGKSTSLDVFRYYLETVYADIVLKSTDPSVFKKVTYIIDFEDLRFKDCLSTDVLDVLITAVKEVEANYPDLLESAYVLNAPSIFPILWNILKPFLSQRTIANVHVFSNNFEKFRPSLLERVPEMNLPRKWGGTGFSKKLSPLNRITGTLAITSELDKGFKETIIFARDKFEITFESKNALTAPVLSWSFKTLNLDLGFSVLWKSFSPNESAEEEIIKYRRLHAQKCIQTGSIVCERNGQYILRFDNTYSRLQSKTLMYYVKMST